MYAGVWEACDGLASGEIATTDVDDNWPAMVELQLYGPDCGFGFHMTVEDAKSLAAHLGAAADMAGLRNREEARARGL